MSETHLEISLRQPYYLILLIRVLYEKCEREVIVVFSQAVPEAL